MSDLTDSTVYLVTSLTAREAGPEHIAVYIRSRNLGCDGTAAAIREAEYDKDLLTAITRLITTP